MTAETRPPVPEMGTTGSLLSVLAALVATEWRRALRSPLLWLGLAIGLLWLRWLWGEYVHDPLILDVVHDRLLAGVALPPAVAAGLWTAIRSHHDTEAGSWLRTCPAPAPLRLTARMLGTLPFAVVALALFTAAVVLARRSDGSGLPRPSTVAGMAVLVLTFALLGALLTMRVPLRLVVVALPLLGAGIVLAGRADAELQAVSPWWGDDQLTVAHLVGGRGDAEQLMAFVALALAVWSLALAAASEEEQPRMRRTYLAAFGLTVTVAVGAMIATVDAHTSPPSPAQVDAIITGDAATACSDADQIRVCTMPGWRMWHDDLRATARRVQDTLAAASLPTIDIVQSGPLPAGFDPDQGVYFVPLPDGHVPVGWQVQDATLTTEAVAAHVFDLPQFPADVWDPDPNAWLRAEECVDERQSVAATLWLVSVTDVDYGRVVRAAADGGQSLTSGGIRPAPNMVRLAAAMLDQDADNVADVVSAQLDELRSGDGDLIGSLGLEQDRFVMTEDDERIIEEEGRGPCS